MLPSLVQVCRRSLLVPGPVVLRREKEFQLIKQVPSDPQYEEEGHIKTEQSLRVVGQGVLCRK